jgi:hypothetical protein
MRIVRSGFGAFHEEGVADQELVGELVSTSTRGDLAEAEERRNIACREFVSMAESGAGFGCELSSCARGIIALVSPRAVDVCRGKHPLSNYRILSVRGFRGDFLVGGDAADYQTSGADEEVLGGEWAFGYAEEIE